jgi:hypothetical protein
MRRLSPEGLLVLSCQGSIRVEPCGSGQQSAIQSPETHFMAVQRPRIDHNTVPVTSLPSGLATEIVIEVRESRVTLILSLRIAKVSLDKDHVRDGEQRRKLSHAFCTPWRYVLEGIR